MKVFEYGRDELNILYEQLKSRSIENRADIEESVREILRGVKERGDAAVSEYTQKFDGVLISPQELEVSASEIEEALESADKELLNVIKRAAENIRAFHERQKENSWFTTNQDGVVLGQKITPLDRAGVYVPAGSAPLPSTVLMNVIPAKVAGVREIVLCSPPDKSGRINPLILACAKIAGADRVFKTGGAQAIGAMAYGTESIPKVDKIVGPGNIYVATAKKLVFGICGIDMIAGPSEVLVIADETANPRYVAADLLSQAEHDAFASAILVTTSKKIADEVNKELQIQLEKLPRKDIASKSVNNYGAIVITGSIDQAVEIANTIAPEHLELCVEDPFSLLPSINNAGAIFLGNFSPEPLGDYYAGPNHTLPTSGTARFSSPLGVYDFVKRQSIISYSKKAFEKVSSDVAAFADAEGLTAHANSIRIREDGGN
ncbi:MAG: histidinol dehydrogenase [Clostridiaceae bacterium]|nr:histidinol dehydrogenase [Clostridiaceae bacterium]